jgi:hypothetical protein
VALQAFHGQQLHGLAQPHVVGQATAQPERGQKRQPRQPALLVGAQRRGEVRRGLQRLQRLGRGPAEQLAQPAVGSYRDDVQRGVDVVGVASGQGEDFGRGRAPGGFACEELQPATQLLRVHRHPLAAQPDQRRLGLGERGDLVLGEGVVADRELPTELDQLVAAELAGLGDHTVDRGVRRQGQPELAAPVPPGRQQNAEPGLVKQRSGGGQKMVSAFSVQAQAGRACGVQRGRELGIDPAGPAELGQQ